LINWQTGLDNPEKAFKKQAGIKRLLGFLAA
jgi:hypothetical protein